LIRKYGALWHLCQSASELLHQLERELYHQAGSGSSALGRCLQQSLHTNETDEEFDYRLLLWDDQRQNDSIQKVMYSRFMMYLDQHGADMQELSDFKWSAPGMQMTWEELHKHLGKEDLLAGLDVEAAVQGHGDLVTNRVEFTRQKFDRRSMMALQEEVAIAALAEPVVAMPAQGQAALPVGGGDHPPVTVHAAIPPAVQAIALARRAERLEREGPQTATAQLENAVAQI
jgi:hypothetical protein